MPEFKHRLGHTEVSWGLISAAGFREHLPGPGEAVAVFDDEGRRYDTKMHSSAARMDGLTQWHKNHSTKVGDLVLIGINPDRSIKLSLRQGAQLQAEAEVEERPYATEIVPSMERLLEDFLERNLDRVERGLKLYQDETGIPGRQYPTDVGTIDLLCRDKDGRFVVLEIKKERGSDRVVGQITRYMGWVKRNLAKNVEVRGIIVVHEIDERLEYSASVVPNVEVKYYKIDLKFVSREELE